MHDHAMDGRPLHVYAALAVLAAPRRFDLLLLMLGGEERSVSQLAETVGLSQSCTTRHLQALARAGLVKGVRDGKRVVFRIAPRDVAARAVLVSLSGGRAAGTLDLAPAEPRRKPAAKKRARDGGPAATPRRKLAPNRWISSRRGDAIPRALGAPTEGRSDAVRIVSAAELEPLVADDGTAGRDLAGAERPSRDSGKTSEPEAPPAWKRSDLEDFLL
jgi:DNA-binding transcriptional ArsR family regulator